MSIQDDNQEVMRRWFGGHVWGNEDHEAAEAFIDAHYAADGKAYGIGGQFVEGPDGFKAFRRAVSAAFPKQSFELTHLHAHDDMVWLRYEGKLTTRAGDTYILVGGGPLEMANGKITKAWNMVNFLELLEEAGAIQPNALIDGFSAIAAR